MKGSDDENESSDRLLPMINYDHEPRKDKHRFRYSSPLINCLYSFLLLLVGGVAGVFYSSYGQLSSDHSSAVSNEIPFTINHSPSSNFSLSSVPLSLIRSQLKSTEMKLFEAGAGNAECDGRRCDYSYRFPYRYDAIKKSKAYQYFPHLLTWRPQIDCAKGSYLHYRFTDGGGFGTAFISYLYRIYDTAAQYNLTLINYPYQTHEHNAEENNLRRDRMLGFSLFEIEEGEWNNCSDVTPIKKNIIEIEHSTYFAMGLGKALEEKMRQLAADGIGFTLKVSANLTPSAVQQKQLMKFDLSPSAFLVQLVYHVRYFLLHRNILHQYRFPHLSLDEFQSLFHIGVHVRHGDITNPVKYKNPGETGRMVPINQWVKAFRNLTNHAPKDFIQRIAITIQTEGDEKDFQPWIDAMKEAGVYDIAVYATHPSSFAVAMLSDADMIYGSVSSFGDAAAIQRADRLYMGFTHYHHMRNHIESVFLQTKPNPANTIHPLSPSYDYQRLWKWIMVYWDFKQRAIDHDRKFPHEPPYFLHCYKDLWKDIESRGFRFDDYSKDVLRVGIDVPFASLFTINTHNEAMISETFTRIGGTDSALTLDIH